MKTSKFLNINFLEIYYQKHPEIKHLFAIDTNVRIYAQILKIKFNKTSNYLKWDSLVSKCLRYISFKVLYLTNSFITNVPSYISDRKINLHQLIDKIKDNYSVIVIPDFLFNNLQVEDNSYTKIEVEEEMVLTIRGKWNKFDDYMLSLRKKYRNKAKNIIKKTQEIKIRKLNERELKKHQADIQNLFIQVVNSSKFQGPHFNTDSFILFVKLKYMIVNGYFLNKKLIGFSSEIHNGNELYSYFVGFDKKLNQKIPIYGRIIIENINSAILLSVDSLILGRRANEFKSNFGARPIKSYVYLKVRNKLLRTVLHPIYIRLSVNKWKLRNALK